MKTQYVTVKLTMRQARYLDALLEKSLERESGLSPIEMTRVQRGSIKAVAKKVSALVYQADVDRSIGREQVKAMVARRNAIYKEGLCI